MVDLVARHESLKKNCLKLITSDVLTCIISS